MDTISDMLTQIRNAQAVFKTEVFVPFSDITYKIAKILEREKFIQNIKKSGRGIRKKIRIGLKYEDKKPYISGLSRISKPGQRIYRPAKKVISRRLGITIVSTPIGLITGKEAKKKNVGGEIIAEIW